MNIFKTKEVIESPFMGVKWDTNTGKVLAKTELWNRLPPDNQTEALATAHWDFYRLDNHHFVKHIVPTDDATAETFFLLPADGWFDTLQKLEKLQQEYNQTREQLFGFVQNVPIPMIVVSNDKLQKILFSNQLLLQFFDLPLAKLYSGLTLQDLFKLQTDHVITLFHQSRQSKQPIQQIIEVAMDPCNKKFLLLRIFPFKTSFIDGIILGILDLTKEKEQEERLIEAYNELQTSTEELAQAHDSLVVLHNELQKSNQLVEERKRELEESLKAAQRLQKKLLLNVDSLSVIQQYYPIKMKVFPHSIVAGDFILVISDHFHLENWNFVVLGDATGHGPSGAMLALTTSMLLKSYILKLRDIEQIHTVIQKTHYELLDILEANQQIVSTEGAEIALLAIPKDTQQNPYFYFSAAGRPLFVLDKQKQLTTFNQNTRAVGWFLKDAPVKDFYTQQIPLQPQDTVFVFTDGLTDQTNIHNQKIGKKRVHEWLQQTATYDILDQKVDFVVQQWSQWKSEQRQTDDALILSVQFE